MLTRFQIIFHFLIRFNSIKQISITSVAMMLLLWVVAAFAQTPGPTPPKIGGPCDYVSYKGTAKIVSIIPRMQPTYPGKEEYEIKFLFSPDEKDSRGKFFEGREFLFTPEQKFPGKELLKQYDLKIGKIFPCVADLEVGGGCTPLIFRYPFMEEGQKEQQAR